MIDGKHTLIGVLVAGVSLAALSPHSASAQDRSLDELQATTISPEEPADEPDRQSEEPDLPEPVPPPLTDADETGTQDSFSISSVALEGTEALDYDVFAETLAGYSGRELDQDGLADLTRQIAELARDEGYLFATAYIPEQAVTLGILRVILEEGRIDEVRVIGSDNRQARAFLDRLVGTVATRDTLERQLLLVSDIPGVYLRSPRLEKEDGRNVLIVEVGDRRDRGEISFDNYGTDNFGPLRAKTEADFYTVLSDSDHLELSARTNPVDPGEFLFSALEYSVGLGGDGARLGVAGSIGDADSSYFDGNLDGDTLFVAVQGSYPLLRSRNAGLWAELTAEHLKIQRDFSGEPIRSDITTTISAGLDGRLSLLEGWLFVGAQFVQGVDALGATRLGDQGASRDDGDGVFSKTELYGRWRGDLVDDLELTLYARGQIASRPLLATQDLGLGGAYRVRGYDFSELSGEDGFYSLAELSHRWDDPTSWLERLELYAFVDGGYVYDRNEGGRGGGLVSTGPGVRLDGGLLSLEVEAAVPVTRKRDTSDDHSPLMNIQLGVNF